jgi:hypothetical protein
MLLERGDELFRLAPLLTGLRVTEAAGLVGALAQLPHLGRLTALHLGGTWITPGEAAELAGSPHLAGLAVLQLPNCALGDEGLRALVRSPALPRLADWVLTDNGLSDDGLAVLAGSSHFPRLASLHFGHDAVGAMRYDSITRGGLLGLAGSRFLLGLTAIHWYGLTDRAEAAGTTEEVLGPPRPGAPAVRLVTHVDTIW